MLSTPPFIGKGKMQIIELLLIWKTSRVRDHDWCPKLYFLSFREPLDLTGEYYAFRAAIVQAGKRQKYWIKAQFDYQKWSDL